MNQISVTNNYFNKRLNDIFLNSTLLLYNNLEKYVEEPDEEALHQVRVSARKLENLFESFGKLSPHEDYYHYLKVVKGIIKLFSPKREIDVCMIMTLDYFRIVKTESLLLEGFFTYLLNLKQKLGNNIFISKKLKRFINNKESFEKFIRLDLFSGLKNLTKSDAKEYLISLIPSLHLKFMMYKDEVVSYPENIKALHKMRLKAKPLRYTLDFAIDIFEIKQTLRDNKIKDFVNLAGYIHDIDELLERVNLYKQTVRSIQRKDKSIVKDGSLKLFERYFLKQRKDTYKSLKKLLLNLNQKIL